MATAKPRRKTATQPTAPARSNGHTLARAAATAATGRPEAPATQRTRGTRARTDRESRPASAQLVADVRSGLRVTREFFARLTGFSVRAITDWEAGRPISKLPPGLKTGGFPVHPTDRVPGSEAALRETA